MSDRDDARGDRRAILEDLLLDSILHDLASIRDHVEGTMNTVLALKAARGEIIGYASGPAPDVPDRQTVPRDARTIPVKPNGELDLRGHVFGKPAEAAAPASGSPAGSPAGPSSDPVQRAPGGGAQERSTRRRPSRSPVPDDGAVARGGVPSESASHPSSTGE